MGSQQDDQATRLSSHQMACEQRAQASRKEPVDQRGRYSNLPASKLHGLRKLAHGDFAKQVRELHELLITPKGSVDKLL
jgi:hypothetical protein